MKSLDRSDLYDLREKYSTPNLIVYKNVKANAKLFKLSEDLVDRMKKNGSLPFPSRFHARPRREKVPSLLGQVANDLEMVFFK